MPKKLKLKRKGDKRESGSIPQNKSIKEWLDFSKLYVLISFCEGRICQWHILTVKSFQISWGSGDPTFSLDFFFFKSVSA